MKRYFSLAVPAVVAVSLMVSGFGAQGETAGAARPVAKGSPTAPADPTPRPEPTPKPEPAPEAAEATVDCAVLKCIALTFDDGPSPQYTPQVLQVLTRHHVPATFFMQGPSLKAYPDVAKQVADTPGMEIGNHSMTHPDLTGVSADRLTTEIVGAADLIEQTTGKRPSIMRPPYGSQNETVREAAGADGQAVILWDIDTLDWSSGDPVAVAKEVQDNAAPGAIALMHDVHAASPQALDGMVADLKNRGFTLVTVSELIGKPEPGELYEHGEA